MPRVRYVALGVLAVATLGSLATTLGYAWYLRSDRYRRYCAAYLSQALGLPSDIGRIIPRSWHAREFDDVTVWLPQRRGKALFCHRALLTYTPAPKDPSAYEIILLGGTSEVSTRTWLREDYRRVIESGLRPGFVPGGPQQVRFSNMDLRFERGQFRGSLEGASGVVAFQSEESGSATIACRALNGYVAPEPALLHAQFSPHATGIQIDQLELTVPNLPLSVLDLRSLVGVDVRSGTFNGHLTYHEADGVRRVSLAGTCSDVSLAECTTGLTSRPWRGSCLEVELQELTLENRRPQRLRFRGVLTGVVLDDMLAPWGLAGAGGELILRVRDADFSPAGIERLVASGECTDVSLAALTERFGDGQMSGLVRLVIDDLTIEQNHLSSLDADLRVEPGGEPKWIEGRLLTGLIGRLLQVNLPPVLPERIEYTQLGVRLDVRDEVLHVFGTHGPRDKTILTVRLFDQDVPLLGEPESAFDLSGWFDKLRSQAAEYLHTRLDELARQRDRGATSPASTAARP